MECLLKWSENLSVSEKVVFTIAGSACIATTGIFIFIGVKTAIKNKKLRNEFNSAGKNVVVLHRFPNGKLCPNLSPYVIKIESFLRVSGIKYVNDFEQSMGPRQLCPWITFNGSDFSDSQLILEHLSKHFKLDFDKHLTPQKKATVEMARIMLEEQQFWVLALHRYYHDKSTAFLTSQEFPSKKWYYMFKYIVGNHIFKRAQAQGMARFTKEQQFDIYKKSVQYLNDILGDGKYYGGDQLCSADFCIYGFLMQLKYNAPGTDFEAVYKGYPLIDKYCERMNAEIYPDWEDQLSIPARSNNKK